MNAGDPPDHHQLFGGLEPWTGTEPPDAYVDFLGIRTQRKFEAGLVAEGAAVAPRSTAPAPSIDTPKPLPAFDEEYFEWVDIAESVTAARDRYVFVEVGAGFGRWCVRAAKLVERLNPVQLLLVAVEPEPTHFGWISEHLSDNGIDPSDHRLIESAVAGRRGRVSFSIGSSASAWYGQTIVTVRSRARRWWWLFKRGVSRLIGRPVAALRMDERWSAVKVRAVTLADVLEGLDRVDLLDIDIQGAEADALLAARETLPRVRLVHVGTHSSQVESALRGLFGELGWACVRDCTLGSTQETPYGPIAFEDGVQTWLNPTLA